MIWHFCDSLWEYWRAPRLPSISHLAWDLITPHWLPVWKIGFITQWHPYTSLPASYDLGSHRCGYGYPPPCASLMLLAYFKLSLSLDVITIKQKKKYPYWLANPPPLLWISEYLREPRLALNSRSSCSQLLGFELLLSTMCPQWFQTEQNTLLPATDRKGRLCWCSAATESCLLHYFWRKVALIWGLCNCVWVRTEDTWLVLEKSARQANSVKEWFYAK